MSYSDVLYSIWLSLRYPAGDETPGKLLAKLRRAADIYKADKELLYSLGFSSKQIRPLSAKSLEQAERTAEICARNNIAVIPYHDPNYPVQLIQTGSPPAVLYCKGTLPAFDDNLFISAVGTRNMSDSGKRNAHRLCFDLASAGAVVVSGMARGIDSVCHCGALDGGGKTVAILGSGCDVIYPPENSYLYGSIVDNGAVISEFPPGEEPKAENFPVRNRLIAALGACTVIIEAGIGSGALITADRASAMGRPLYAVPGQISTPSSKGSNLLLKQGAKLCVSAEDILQEYEMQFPDKIRIENVAKNKYYIGDYSERTAEEDAPEFSAKISDPADGMKISRASELSGEDRKIYEALLKKGACSPEDLAFAGVDMSGAVYRLTLLEIGGYVTALPGGKYTVK